MKTREAWLQILSKIRCGPISGGSIEKHFENGVGYVKQLISLGAIKERDAILDIGCGNGRIALGIEQNGLIEKISYTGYDIIKDCISFDNFAFFDNRNVEFKHIDIPIKTFISSYNKNYGEEIVNSPYPGQMVGCFLPDIFQSNLILSPKDVLHITIENATTKLEKDKIIIRGRKIAHIEN